MATTVRVMPSASETCAIWTAWVAQRVGRKLAAIESEGRVVGDVKRLTGQPPRFRLRVGDWQMLFTVDGDLIKVYRILHRREAYE